MLIPLEIIHILKKLQESNFSAYLVGGCVRDSILKKSPNDWDIATSAFPEEIRKLFPDSVYENQFGTVMVKTESSVPTLKIVEVTTFRREGKYSDKRHPDVITFAKTLRDDLQRRDFTINAMAYDWFNKKIIDPFHGEEDLKHKLIRAVGDPSVRFREDALRLMRAIRLACELNFQIEPLTLQAIKENAFLLQKIAKERIRDEFIRIIKSKEAAKGIILLQQTMLLHQFLPELEKGIGVTQNKHHIYSVWEHLWRSLDYAAKKNYSLEVRLASLFHDIGKPDVKEGEGKDSTFYNHEARGAYLTRKILSRLRFPHQQVNKIEKLVRYHGFVYEPNITTDAAIRRLLRKVGGENIKELAQVREADRIGSGCPKAVPFRLRHFLFRVEKITKQLKGEEPSLRMLALNGNDVMKILKIKPGKQVGILLNILLEEILDDPKKNTKEYLQSRLLQLHKLSFQQLKSKEKRAKERYKDLLQEEERKIKEKYYVN